MLAMGSPGVNRHRDSFIYVSKRSLQRRPISSPSTQSSVYQQPKPAAAHHLQQRHKQHQKQSHKQLEEQCQKTEESLKTPQDQVSSTGEHYIHSRLKSSLGSGKKETLYSGVLEGNTVRRVASLNARAKNQMLCVPDPLKANGSFKSHIAAENGEVPVNNPSSVVDVPFEVADDVYRSTLAAGQMDTSEDLKHTSSLESGAVSVPVQPEALDQTSLIPGDNFPCHVSMKNASVEVFDVIKTAKGKPVKTKDSSCSEVPKSVSSNAGTTNYVRRMASLNASACVSALMSPVYSTGKLKAVDKHTSPSVAGRGGGHAAGKKRPSGNSCTNDNKKGKLSIECVHKAHVQRGHATTSEDGGDANGGGTSIQQSSSSGSQSGQEAISSADSDQFELNCSECLSSTSEESNREERNHPLPSPFGIEGCYNSLGLLYSGDCMYSRSRIFYDMEGRIPKRIVPVVKPSRSSHVHKAVADILKQKVKSSKRSTKVSACLLHVV